MLRLRCTATRYDWLKFFAIYWTTLINKYTLKGGSITLTAVVAHRTVMVTVSDNGIRIAPEALPNVFDLFVQGPHASTAHGGGLGIGLAVVRDLVEAHGGSVIASSAGHDLGSEFVVTLPIAEGSRNQLA